MLISRHQYDDLDALFRKTMWQSVGVCLAGATALLVALYWLRLNFAMGSRFLPLSYVVILLVPTLSNQILFAQAIYLRAHKQEPFLTLSILIGLITGTAVFVFGREYGALGVTLGYAVVQIAALPFSTWIWRRRRREWHG